MNDANVASRLKLFVLVLFIGGFVFLVASVPLAIFNVWDIALPFLIIGGTLLFVGVLLSLFFHSWIDEAIKKGKK